MENGTASGHFEHCHAISAIFRGFKNLKGAFTLAPTLKHPDPSKPFIVEVDTSETGVGGILSQRFGEKPKLYTVSLEVVPGQM